MPASLRSYSETKVSPGQSRQDVEELLVKVGAKGFRWASTVGYPGRESLEAVIEWEDRPFSFRIEVSFKDERQRWRLMRALYWYLKTKIEAVQLGLVDLEHEFLPYLITKEGRTVFEQLQDSLPKMLGAPLVEPE